MTTLQILNQPDIGLTVPLLYSRYKDGTNITSTDLNWDVPFEPSSFTTRASIPSIKEWTNGVYNFNHRLIKNLPVADTEVNKLLKNYFSATPYDSNEKRTRLAIRRINRMSLNSILVTQPEIKHFMHEIKITAFLYNKKKSSLLRKLNQTVELLDYPLNNTSSDRIWEMKMINNRNYTNYKNSKSKIKNLNPIKKKLYRRRKLEKFFHIKQKLDVNRRRLWQSKKQMMGLKLNKNNFFKSSILYNQDILVLPKKKHIKYNKTQLLKKYAKKNFLLLKSKSILISLKQFSNYKTLLNLQNYILKGLNKSNLFKRKWLKKRFNKIKLNLSSLIINMSEKGYKLNEIAKSINQKLHLYIYILNYVHKKYIIRKDIELKSLTLKTYIAKLNKTKKFKTINKSYRKKSLHKKSITKNNLNIKWLKKKTNLSKQLVKPNLIAKNNFTKKKAKLINKFLSDYTTKNLSLLPSKLNINTFNFINLPFSIKNINHYNNQVKLTNIKQKLIYKVEFLKSTRFKKIRYTWNDKAKVIILTNKKIQPVFDNVKFIKLPSKCLKIKKYISNSILYKNQILSSSSVDNSKLISIYVRGRKLKYFEKKYAKNLIFKTHKDNITKVMHRLYIYKTKNMNFFFNNYKKLIPNKYLGFKRKYKVSGVNNSRYTTSKLKTSKRYLDNNKYLTITIDRNRFKPVLEITDKLENKSLVNYNKKFKILILNNESKSLVKNISSKRFKKLNVNNNKSLVNYNNDYISLNINKNNKLLANYNNDSNSSNINKLNRPVVSYDQNIRYKRLNIYNLNKSQVRHYSDIVHRSIYFNSDAVLRSLNLNKDSVLRSLNLNRDTVLKSLNLNSDTVLEKSNKLVNKSLIRKNKRTILEKANKLINKSLIKKNKRTVFKKLKINNKNIILLNKIDKMNRVLNRYFKLSGYNENSNKVFINQIRNLYKFKYLKDILVKQITFLNYFKKLSFNNTLYKSWVLTPLKDLISKIYNKKVSFNFVNLKYLYLSSDLLTQAIVLKLRNIRKNRLHRVLKKVLNLVLISKLNVYTRNSFDPTNKFIQHHYNKFKSLNKVIFKPTIENKNLKNKKANDSNTLNKPNNVIPRLKWLNQIQTNTLNLIKYKSVFGLKLEASGRLTKRSTASRAVFKFKFKGNLRNNIFMTRNKNPRIKGLNLISNIQYTNINSHNRNGSFGIKAWINNN